MEGMSTSTIDNLSNSCPLSPKLMEGDAVTELGFLVLMGMRRF